MMPDQVYTDPLYTVGSAKLQVVLEDILSTHTGRLCHIRQLDRRPFDRRSSFAIDRLDVVLETGETLALVFKDLSRRALLTAARESKPDFLYNPLREIAMYQAVLPDAVPGAATCYGAVVEQASEHYWLFLEYVAGRELYAVGIESWKAVAEWLAGMHTRMAETYLHSQFTATSEPQTLSPPQRVPLLRYTPELYARWCHRMQDFTRPAPLSQRQAVGWLTRRYGQVVQRLLALPLTLIHGELYASNVLVQYTDTALRVCPIDWEMAAIAPALFDLATLTAGSWCEAERQDLARSYYTALPLDSPWRVAWDAFLTNIDCCRLHLAVQWLGWSPVGAVESEQWQSWLHEALRLAEELRV